MKKYNEKYWRDIINLIVSHGYSYTSGFKKCYFFYCLKCFENILKTCYIHIQGHRRGTRWGYICQNNYISLSHFMKYIVQRTLFTFIKIKKESMSVLMLWHYVWHFSTCVFWCNNFCCPNGIFLFHFFFV